MNKVKQSLALLLDDLLNTDSDSTREELNEAIDGAILTLTDLIEVMEEGDMA